MKKKILLMISMAVSTFVMAQTSPTFGIRAGLSSAGIRGDAVNSLQNVLDFSNGMITTSDRNGLFIGGFAAIPVSNVVTVEPGLYYSQKGYTLKGALNIKGFEFLGANARAQLNADYIDVPVVLKMNMDGLQIFAGPQISYLAKADLKTTAGLLGINLLNSTIDASSQFNKWDMGVTAGVGYQFSSGFNIMASYDHGLSKIDANKNLNSYNRSFKVGAGFRF